LHAIEERVPLGPLTTLGIGGPARYLTHARTEAAVQEALVFAERRALPMFILGGGSNVLVADEGFAGLVLRVAITGVAFRAETGGVTVTAGAGEDWDALVRAGVERGLAGHECLSGIPGLVGGTPIQNVGAYGQEVSETIVGVRAYDLASGRVVELAGGACGFGYRTSVFNTTARGRYIVLAVTYRLVPRGRPTVRYAEVRELFTGRDLTSSAGPTLAEVRDAVRAVRARKAMLLVAGDPDCRSAGSFFKNPVVTADELARIAVAAEDGGPAVPAGGVPHHDAPGGLSKVPGAWLIERAGFPKGYGRGRAGLSTRHTLAIVNRGGATAREVLALMREIQDRVRDRFGVTLVPEPVFVGFAEPWGRADGPALSDSAGTA